MRHIYTAAKLGPDPIILVKKQLTFHGAIDAYGPVKLDCFFTKIVGSGPIF